MVLRDSLRASVFAVAACAAGVVAVADLEAAGDLDSAADLEIVARSPSFAMNGVAVTADGRVFVSTPQWTEEDAPSVAEVTPDGAIVPYPGGAWNDFDPAQAMDRLVNVNAVHADGAGSL